jgi:adhesin transport system outer membrane protein
MRLPYLKTHAVSAERTHASYQQQFNLGQRTLLDLLDQENEKFTAQSDYINGVYDEKVACYRLLASMGVILETLDIVLVEAETSVAE